MERKVFETSTFHTMHCNLFLAIFLVLNRLCLNLDKMEFYSLLWTFVVLCPVLLPVCNGICQPFVFTKAEIGFAGNGSKANPLVVGHRVGRQPYDVPPDKAAYLLQK